MEGTNVDSNTADYLRRRLHDEIGTRINPEPGGDIDIRRRRLELRRKAWDQPKEARSLWYST
jgi:hypothetical protein